MIPPCRSISFILIVKEFYKGIICGNDIKIIIYHEFPLSVIFLKEVNVPNKDLKVRNIGMFNSYHSYLNCL